MEVDAPTQSLIIHKANEIAVNANLSCTLSSIHQCNSGYFYDLYKSLTGLNISFVSCNEEKKCQLVTDALEMLLYPHIKLNHIEGSSLARLDIMTIKHMLDIFSMLFNSLPCEQNEEILCRINDGTPSHSSKEEMCTPIHHSTPHAKARSRIFPSHSVYKKSEIQRDSSATQKNVNYYDIISPGEKTCVLKCLLSRYLQDFDPKLKAICCPTLSSKSLLKPDLKIMQDVIKPNILHHVENHFPFVFVEPSTLRYLRHRQIQQFDSLSKFEPALSSSVSRKAEQIIKRQQQILQIAQKDLARTRHIKESQTKQYHDQCIRRTLQSKRLAAARAHRYLSDYELQMKSKLQQARTKEEQIFIKAFESGLKLQREEVRDARKCAKESQLLLIENQQLETFDHLLCHERNGKHKECRKIMKTKFRKEVEEEIKQLQHAIQRNNDVQHFRELDAGKIQWKFASSKVT